MQWSQIKTLFILCFLILDVYLLIQFFDKQEKNDLDVKEGEESSIEQQLRLEEIELPDDLQDKDKEQSYISVERKDLSEDDLDDIPDSDNQDSIIVDDNLLVSKFEDPISVEEKEDVKKEVKDNVMSASEFTYGGWNTDLNVITFFQKKRDHPVYYNDKGLLLLYLNDDKEIIGYTQTMLGEENEDFDTSEKSLIEPIHAIDTLYNKRELYTGEEVTDVSLGYYTSQPIVSDEQTFAPTWGITIKGKNGERNYFIHADEGTVFPHNNVTFLKDAMQTINNSLDEAEKDKDFKKISRQIDKRLKAIKREEEE